mmetsp:Transcript_69966/g.137407  ORF Transcript_69966/g.137407 Transcript_69966/m.137407 type:complete len:232 (+) Transcript_69966:1-696(+)
MFQVMTCEAWSEVVARPLLHTPDAFINLATGFYFVSFQILCAIILINVVVAVLLEKMVDDAPMLPEIPEALNLHGISAPADGGPAKGTIADGFNSEERVGDGSESLMPNFAKTETSEEGEPRPPPRSRLDPLDARLPPFDLPATPDLPGAIRHSELRNVARNAPPEDVRKRRASEASNGKDKAQRGKGGNPNIARLKGEVNELRQEIMEVRGQVAQLISVLAPGMRPSTPS